jgi:hypothetical protein
MAHWRIIDVSEITLDCTGETKEFKSDKAMHMWYKLHIKKCDKCCGSVLVAPPAEHFILKSHTSSDSLLNAKRYDEYREKVRQINA